MGCNNSNKTTQIEEKTTTINVSFNPLIKDYTPIIFNKLKEANSKNISLVFEKGSYHFYPEKALAKYLKISNNDNGNKRIIFPFLDYQSVILDGNQSDFIFHGGVIPFVIEETKVLEMRNFNMLWDKAFTFEGEVVANNSKNRTFTLKVNEDDDYEIKHHQLYFKGYDWKLPMGENIVFNKETKRPYYYTSKYELPHSGLNAREISNGVVQFYNVNKNKDVPPIGSIWVDKGPHGQNRRYPGIRLYNASNINLQDINIYSSGAMALIAEKSENITMTNFNVMLPEGSTRMIGASADATHFINCKGLISFEDCTFENMLDDATNVHGTYMVVSEIINDYAVALKPMHYQQDGFDLASPGDSIRFITRTDLSKIQTNILKNIEQINESHYVLEFENPLDKNITLESAAENISWMASVYMKHCKVRQNRARSILISTSKKVEILDNYFSSMMAGVRVCGDANYWFESGPVTDLLIKGNTFEDLGIGGHNPQAILQIDPIIGKKYRNLGYFHKNITFDNNTIKAFDPHIIYALSVDGLTITNNKIIKTYNHPEIFSDLSEFDIQNCNNVTITGNTFQDKNNNKAEISIKDCNNLNISNNLGFENTTVINPNKYFYQN